MKQIQQFRDRYNTIPLQGKFFYLLIAFGLMMSLATSLTNIISDLGLPIILTTISLGLFCLLILFVTVKTSDYIRSAYFTFWTLLLVIYPALWFFNGGSSGPTLSVYIYNTFLISILFEKTKSKKLLSGQLLTLAILLTIEYSNPTLIEPYLNDRVRFFDLSFAALAIILLSYITVNRLMEEYRLRIDELNGMQQKLHHLSITDELTGIYNRRYIMEKISDQFKKTQRLPFTLVMFDIDDFKLINDRYGHSIGDEVLIGVSTLLHQSVRTVDFVGRIGGEEFLMLLMDTSEEIARKRANTIIKQISEHTWTMDDLNVTISGGLYTPKKSDNLETVLEKVDTALYIAKSNGKNRLI